MIAIEKGIPIPLNISRRGRRVGYPFRVMEVGDSFVAECASMKYCGILVSRNNGKLKPKRFTYARIDKGVTYRIWRIE